MPIDSLQDLSGLNSSELYAVYLAIALADHKWRLQTIYGQSSPPPGHCEFRPLKVDQFDARLTKARTLSDGEAMFRARLARQAAAYRVDVSAELSRIRQAA